LALSKAVQESYSSGSLRQLRREQTARSWKKPEDKSNHLRAVRSEKHRTLRSKIARENWEAPTQKMLDANRNRKGSPAFLEAMRKRGPVPPIQWRRYEGTRGKINMRSLWEIDAARRMDQLGLVWEYEPTTFRLSNGKSYTPEFFVQSPFGPCYVELHRVQKPKPGDEPKLEKLKLASRELPLPLVIMDAKEMAEIKKALRS
jgi:hypothetical protein